MARTCRRGLQAPEQRHVRLSNLTAMYLPGAPAGFLPPDATPVNHMRRVFNLYFDAGCQCSRTATSSRTTWTPFDLEEVGLDNEAPGD